MSLLKTIPNLSGSGSSKKPKSPTLTPDNLFSEDIVEFALAISEGPIRGLHKGAKSFYVGTTPLVSETGDLNFQKFAVAVHPGYPENLVRPIDFVLGGETSNLVVGVALVRNTPVVRQSPSVLRNQIDELECRIKFDRLVTQNDKGTFNGNVKFNLEYKAQSSSTWLPFYSNAQLSITGKTSDGYAVDYKVTVPRVNEDYQVRVTKISVDSTDQAATDITFESLQFTSKVLKGYPNTAIIHAIGVATGQFSSIPDFSSVIDGILCRVPSNYNGDTRVYDETAPWDGSFKFAWTNNPVWILFDLVMNPRYGMVKHYPQVDLNRFDCYAAAKWCDTLVPVINGDTTTMRPRYTFNGVIAEPRPAMELLNYVAGSFNATMWDDLSGQLHLKVDRDDLYLQMFAKENVLDGKFDYTFTDITTRVNDVSVSFINPDLDYNEDRRRIPNVTTDEAAIAEFGRIPEDFIAVGCTNPDEAICKATYRLISSQTEKTNVTFTTVRPGVMLSLFDVILIADEDMGWSQSGRVLRYNEQYIFLRDPIFVENIQAFTLKLQTVDGIFQMNVMPESVGMQTRFLLSEEFPDYVPQNTVYTFEQTGSLGFAKPFRVLTIDEVEDSPYAFRITAIELNRNKYIQSELGQKGDVIQYSFKTPTIPGVPTNILAQSGDDHLLYTATGDVLTRIFVSFTKPQGMMVKSYQVDWRNYNEYDWHTADFDQDHGYLFPVVNGDQYVIRVRSIDTKDNKSNWSDEIVHTAKGKLKLPDSLVSFTAAGGLLQNYLSWQYSTAQDIKSIEIFYAVTDNINTAQLLTVLPFPTTNWTHLGLGVGVRFYYWARILDTSGNRSPFVGPRNARTSISPDVYLEILQGQISESSLNNALKAKIEAPNEGTQILIEQVIDRINGQIYTKIDNFGYITGYGLSTSTQNGVPTSEFIIRADRFAIVRPGAVGAEDNDVIVPFIVGQVNGQDVIGINGQLIVDGTISARAIFIDKLTSLVSDIGEATAGSFNINNKFVVDRDGNMLALSGTFGGKLLAGTLDLSSFSGQTTQYPSAGVYNVVVPNDKTTMRISLLGGSGGGGFGGFANNDINAGGGGGGASNIVVVTLSNLVAGAVYQLTVGARGEAGYAISSPYGVAGTSGGATFIKNGSGTIIAQANGGEGGKGGAGNSAGGAGGAGANGAGSGTAGGKGYVTREQIGSTQYYNLVEHGGPRGLPGLTTNGGNNGGRGGEGAIDVNPPRNPGNITPDPGQPGRAIIEFFNPNSVVLRTDYNILLSALQRQGIAIS